VYFRFEEAVKSLFLHSVIFEEFGLRYIGPIDGHNIKTLISAFNIAKRSDEPILLHVSTTKGKGYAFAEKSPELWHGTSAFECQTGKHLKTKRGLNYSDVFGQTLERIAESNEKIIAITAAMTAGTGLSNFAKRFPSRFYDVGISEEHAVVFAAGLASEGYTPVVAIYSTFAQRVVDYMIHDVCLQRLPVIFCFDRAGLVGDDGPTHHGIFDIPLFRSVPGIVIMQPKDEAELANMLFSAIRWKKPVIIRYPRGKGPGIHVSEVFEELPYGKAEILREGREIQIWALGDMIPLAEKTVDKLRPHGWNIGIINPRFIRPVDQELLSKHSAVAKLIVTIENGTVTGGFGSGIIEQLTKTDFKGHVLPFGWPDKFIPHGSFDLLSERFGMTVSVISDAIINVMKSS